MIINYHPDAIDELNSAAKFYESNQINLGCRFLDAVDISLVSIRRNPLMWPSDKLGRQKCIIRKFPYLLIYKMSDKLVYILAVAHTSRKPRYWKTRDSRKK